jgi:hypothetical protein
MPLDSATFFKAQSIKPTTQFPTQIDYLVRQMQETNFHETKSSLLSSFMGYVNYTANPDTINISTVNGHMLIILGKLGSEEKQHYVAVKI